MSAGNGTVRQEGADRMEALLAGFLDRSLTETEDRDLHEALAANPAALEDLIGLVRVDGLLRSYPSLQGVPKAEQTEIMLRKLEARLGTDPALADAILERIEGGAAAEPARRVREPAQRRHRTFAVSARGPRVPAAAHRRPLGRRRAGRRLLALAASVLVAVGALWHSGKIDPWRHGAGAVLVRGAEHARVVRAGADIASERGMELYVHDGLAAAAGAPVVVRYHDGAELVLEAGTNARLEGNTGLAQKLAARSVGRALLRWGGVREVEKRVAVAGGRMTVEIPFRETPARNVFATPHAEIVVKGTRFILAVQPDSTRIDLERGRVDVLNTTSGESVLVNEGFYAVVGAQTRVAAIVRTGAPAPAPAVPVPAGLAALYTFGEGRGTVVRDVSGVGAPLDLTVADPDAVAWLPGGGLAVRANTVIASAGPARKISEACRVSNALTLEVWIRPADPMQAGPARIVSVASQPLNANLMLGQTREYAPWGPHFGIRVRSTASTELGFPEANTARGTVTTELTHVVCVREAAGAVRLFVNGRDQLGGWTHYDPDGGLRSPSFMKRRPVPPGTLANWASDFPLVLANEATGDRPWLGEYHRVALYSRALSENEVRAAFRRGRPQTGRRGF
ncbi:MAG: LamG domain-containing protein [Kiritimatiellae bacterium]|nr:LamG domain-containing protein [Kiritimatiellia bacterium]